MERVGFIGLGTMGLPMMWNMAKSGIPLSIWNRTPKFTDRVSADSDVEVAATARTVLRETRKTILMLLDHDAVDAVLERGTQAFCDNVKGKTLIAMGSIDPQLSIALAQDIEAAGGAYLEAPVSGSRIPAERGELVCLLGGDPDLADAAAPLLHPMCKEQIYCGGTGSALRMKLAINIYLCSSLVALAEATNFAARAGLPLEKFNHAILNGPLSSDFAAIKLPKMIRSDFDVQAGVLDAYTSTQLIRREAERLRAATPQLEASSDLYGQAVAALGPHVDMSAVIQVLDQN